MRLISSASSTTRDPQVLRLAQDRVAAQVRQLLTPGHVAGLGVDGLALDPTPLAVGERPRSPAARSSKASNELRSILREYYPPFLDAFAGKSATNLAKPDARAVLAIAPTPAHAAKLTKTRIATALRRAGHQRCIDDRAAEILQRLHIPQLRQPGLVEQAMGRQALALLAMLDAACSGSDDLNRPRPKNSASTPTMPSSPAFPAWPR
ncbi:hypothetical protein [Nocardia sp. NPDC047038]|uniref:hypothetical protein n=1 Tax=Nocardia sp. NPDC047038 TaxID=3154338 RepID=UPI0033DB35F6